MKKKILLVDDVKLFLKLEETFFKRTGCEILTADTGMKALDLAKSEGPDLVLLDYIMPDMMGDEICRQLKTDADTSKIPVIMVSTSANEEDVGKCLAAGARDYVTKPINAKELLQKAAAILEIPQRVHFRLAVTIKVMGESSGQIFSGVSRNLSQGGILVECPKEIPANATVSLDLPILAGQGILNLVGQVVRQEPDHACGQNLVAIRFVEMAPDQEKSLSDFIAHHATRGAPQA